MSERTLELRPMGVGELLDAAFRLYRRHFWLFVGAVAAVQVPLTLLSVVYDLFFSPLQRLQSVGDDTGRFVGDYLTLNDYFADFFQLFFVQLIVALVTLFTVYGLINGAVTHLVHNHYRGRPLDLVDAYRALGWRWVRILGGFVLLGVVNGAVSLLFIIPCVGWIAALALLVYLNVPALSFLAPLVVVEDKSATQALKRAWSLGRRQFWRVLGVNFLLGLLMGVLWGALTLVWNVVFNLWDPGFYLQTGLTSLASLLVTLFVQPILVCGLALLYFDLRIRLEGFDLELRAERLSAGA